MYIDSTTILIYYYFGGVDMAMAERLAGWFLLVLLVLYPIVMLVLALREGQPYYEVPFFFTTVSAGSVLIAAKILLAVWIMAVVIDMTASMTCRNYIGAILMMIVLCISELAMVSLCKAHANYAPRSSEALSEQIALVEFAAFFFALLGGAWGLLSKKTSPIQ